MDSTVSPQGFSLINVCTDIDKLCQGAQCKHMGSMGRLPANVIEALNTALHSEAGMNLPCTQAWNIQAFPVELKPWGLQAPLLQLWKGLSDKHY